ncbi:hypothetical protein IHE44_0003545 [Lamprotornis superbus]|uniref:Uncharacterized protein n=1 Tax=Lamprotornis superbus TaxID=245042 RepID=A0A835NZP6_9PASS|nr:hypothetical protein IHE44_0003545 [Lamprotornis superbus]
MSFAKLFLEQANAGLSHYKAGSAVTLSQKYSSIPRFMVCPEYEHPCATFCSYPAIWSSGGWLAGKNLRAAEFASFPSSVPECWKSSAFSNCICESLLLLEQKSRLKNRAKHGKLIYLFLVILPSFFRSLPDSTTNRTFLVKDRESYSKFCGYQQREPCHRCCGTQGCHCSSGTPRSGRHQLHLVLQSEGGTCFCRGLVYLNVSPFGMMKHSWHPRDVDVRALAFICLGVPWLQQDAFFAFFFAFFFGVCAFLVGMIILASRTPRAFALVVFFLVLCRDDSALSQPCDLVSVCYGPRSCARSKAFPSLPRLCFFKITLCHLPLSASLCSFPSSITILAHGRRQCPCTDTGVGLALGTHWQLWLCLSLWVRYTVVTVGHLSTSVRQKPVFLIYQNNLNDFTVLPRQQSGSWPICPLFSLPFLY